MTLLQPINSSERNVTHPPLWKEFYEQLDSSSACPKHEPCEESELDIAAYRYIYPVLTICCLIGNGFNIAIYSHKSFHGTQTMKFFIYKAVANITLVVSLGTNFIRVVATNSNPSWVFWKSYPIMLFVGNVAQCLAVWLTLFLTVEMLLCIIMPIGVRTVCRSQVVNSLLATVTAASIALQSYHLIATHVVTCGWKDREVHRLVVREGHAYAAYEKVYFWLQSLLSVIVPFIVMLFICVISAWNYNCRRNAINQRSTSIKLCILKITFATLLSHLVCESTLVYLNFKSAFFGSSRSSDKDCAVSTIGNFMILTNASLSFFLYVAINHKFRSLFISRLTRVTEFGASSLRVSGSELAVPLKPSAIPNPAQL